MSISLTIELRALLVSLETVIGYFCFRYGKIFYFKGTDKADSIQVKEIKNLAVRENLDKRLGRNKLITVLKVSDDTPYGKAVEILDQLNLAEVDISGQLSKEFDKDGKPVDPYKVQTDIVFPIK